MNKIYLIFYIALTQFYLPAEANNSMLRGRIINKNIDNSGIDGASVFIINENMGCYSDENGYFTVNISNMKKKGQLFITRFDFISQIVDYNILLDDDLTIELIPNYDYYYTPPLSGPIEDFDTVYIQGYVYDNSSIPSPLSGVLIYMANLPYSTISNKDGSFTLKPSKIEITYYAKKEFILFFDKKGYQSETSVLLKNNLEKSIENSNDVFYSGNFFLDQYISPSDIELKIQAKINSITGNFQSNNSRSIDSAFLDDYNATIEDLKNSIDGLYKDTLKTSKTKVEVEQLLRNQNTYLQLLAKQNELDSIYLATVNSMQSSIETNNNSIKNLNEIDTSIINALKDLGLNVSSTREDLTKRIEDNIIKFNENARILNESYLKRSRQYDTTAFQVFFTIPVTLGPRYSDFVSASTFGQIGFNTNYGFKFLQKAKIYNSYSFNFLSFANADTNYHTLEDGTVLWANTKDITANYFSWAINFRPPIDFIPNLKIDPGFGFSVGYDYKNIEYYKTNDTLPKIGAQAFVQVAVQYKIFTPAPDFTNYNPNLFASDSNDMERLTKSGMITPADLIEKYHNSFEYYNYKKSKSIKNKQIFQNLGHNTYIYFTITDRLVFKDKKYLYGLANFALGLKFDISSFVNNQKTMNINCRATNYCQPNKPVF